VVSKANGFRDVENRQSTVLTNLCAPHAGFFASRLALGHGLGLIGDIVVGILGAVLGGFLARVFHVNIVVTGHTTISAMIVAFIGAAILLLVVRIFSGGRRR
jgi:uncharacterized membrane protein YeaQ/YmgE (transglycosylase-associated protein family)